MEFLCQLMCDSNRQRQIFRSFISRITIHKSLISCSSCIDSLGYIRWLGVDKFLYFDSISVVIRVITIIPDRFDCISCYLFIVNDSSGSCFSCNDKMIVGSHTFAGNSRVRVLGKCCIQNCIADLVAEFVRMSGSNWFACNKMSHDNKLFVKIKNLFSWREDRRYCLWWQRYLAIFPEYVVAGRMEHLSLWGGCWKGHRAYSLSFTRDSNRYCIDWSIYRYISCEYKLILDWTFYKNTYN